jgi:hypothetical protein
MASDALNASKRHQNAVLHPYIILAFGSIVGEYEVELTQYLKEGQQLGFKISTGSQQELLLRLLGLHSRLHLCLLAVNIVHMARLRLPRLVIPACRSCFNLAGLSPHNPAWHSSSIGVGCLQNPTGSSWSTNIASLNPHDPARHSYSVDIGSLLSCTWSPSRINIAMLNPRNSAGHASGVHVVENTLLGPTRHPGCIHAHNILGRIVVCWSLTEVIPR